MAELRVLKNLPVDMKGTTQEPFRHNTSIDQPVNEKSPLFVQMPAICSEWIYVEINQIFNKPPTDFFFFPGKAIDFQKLFFHPMLWLSLAVVDVCEAENT